MSIVSAKASSVEILQPLLPKNPAVLSSAAGDSISAALLFKVVLLESRLLPKEPNSG